MIATWSEGLADENMAEDILVESAGIGAPPSLVEGPHRLDAGLAGTTRCLPAGVDLRRWMRLGLHPGGAGAARAIAPSAWTSPAPCSSGSSASARGGT